MSRFGNTLHGGPVNAEEIARVREVVMFKPPDLQTRLVRFWGFEEGNRECAGRRIS